MKVFQGHAGGTRLAANDNRKPRRTDGAGRRASVAALLAVLLIGLALYWTVSAIRAHDAVQNCLDAGRHDCAESDDP